VQMGQWPIDETEDSACGVSARGRIAHSSSGRIGGELHAELTQLRELTHSDAESGNDL
jgi:hypothetical protein